MILKSIVMEIAVFAMFHVKEGAIMTEPIIITDRKMFFRDFLSTVRKMRECQRRYFRSRSVDAMRESKMYEKKIDEMLATIEMMPKRKLPLDEAK